MDPAEPMESTRSGENRRKKSYPLDILRVTAKAACEHKMSLIP